ncbi:MAG TPA: YhcN/YlaJ family sporulation lipoprotein [Clostridiales bacterium]|nr:YhcN/YlaJ family sporulation lipoprotein [Clostridiales bacterium]
MRKIYKLLSILVVILIGLLAVSCTVPRRPQNTVPPASPNTRQTRFIPRTSPAVPPMTSPGPYFTPGPYNNYNWRTTRDPLNNNRTGNTTPMGGNWQERAERIADAAARQKEVESAACVITGNTAVVGLQFDDQYKGKLTDAIKKKVEERCLDADNRIKRVVVTADPDLVSRLEEMFNDIGKGKPISGFTKEINEIINRINPK